MVKIINTHSSYKYVILKGTRAEVEQEATLLFNFGAVSDLPEQFTGAPHEEIQVSMKSYGYMLERGFRTMGFSMILRGDTSKYKGKKGGCLRDATAKALRIRRQFIHQHDVCQKPVNPWANAYSVGKSFGNGD